VAQGGAPEGLFQTGGRFFNAIDFAPCGFGRSGVFHFFCFSGAFRALALMIQPFRRAFENSKKKARALKPLQASS